MLEGKIRKCIFFYVKIFYDNSMSPIFFTVTERLNSIDKRYQELQELAKLRKQRLLDALSLYKLFTEADGVEQWINEKEKMLVTMVPGKFLLILIFSSFNFLLICTFENVCKFIRYF